MSVRHFTTDLDLTSAEQARVIQDAIAMKTKPEDYRDALAGKVLGMIFTKSSTRTRVSFEAGMCKLGGDAIFLSSSASQMGRGEPISDTGQVLSRYLDLIMIRTFAHADVAGLAASSRVPVINGLDDVYHPCQALADLMTITETKGELAGLQLVYVGDGNNMTHSLMLASARAGMHCRWLGPEGWEPNARIIETARSAGADTGARIDITSDLAGAEGADVIYTDTWASMGQEAEKELRQAAFAAYQVDAALMARAKKDAIFMHCLPAYRGSEVSAEVIDGPQSVVFDEAENRMHAQNALMVFLQANSAS